MLRGRSELKLEEQRKKLRRARMSLQSRTEVRTKQSIQLKGISENSSAICPDWRVWWALMDYKDKVKP